MPASANALQALYEIVLVLASDQGKLAERLGRVYFFHLERLDASAFPHGVQQQLQVIRDELRRLYPEHGQVGEVDVDRASDIAQRIMMLYDAVLTERT
jgi:hypothetical protein